MDMVLVTIIFSILGLALIVLILKEGTKYWQWMPMHSLWYKITKKKRYKSKPKVRWYNEVADLYQCPTCRHYLWVDEISCSYCGQRIIKRFWV